MGKCPSSGILAATSTFIYARNFQIWKQNMVVSKLPGAGLQQDALVPPSATTYAQPRALIPTASPVPVPVAATPQAIPVAASPVPVAATLVPVDASPVPPLPMPVRSQAPEVLAVPE